MKKVLMVIKTSLIWVGIGFYLIGHKIIQTIKEGFEKEEEEVVKKEK
jgi:hypothetical protein